MLRVFASLHIKNIHLQFNFHVMFCSDKQKTKIMASGPITSWEIDGEIMDTVTEFLGEEAPKSTQMVTAVRKLKDACSLGEKS